jgi:hypothetical protein
MRHKDVNPCHLLASESSNKMWLHMESSGVENCSRTKRVWWSEAQPSHDSCPAGGPVQLASWNKWNQNSPIVQLELIEFLLHFERDFKHYWKLIDLNIKNNSLIKMR